MPDCKGGGDENRMEEVSGGLDYSIWGGVTSVQNALDNWNN